MNKVHVAAIIFGFTAASAGASNKIDCDRTLERAEVVNVEDLSQSLQLPVLANDGKTLERIDTFSTGGYRVTLLPRFGFEITVMMKTKPVSQFVTYDLTVCPRVEPSRREYDGLEDDATAGDVRPVKASTNTTRK